MPIRRGLNNGVADEHARIAAVTEPSCTSTLASERAEVLGAAYGQPSASVDVLTLLCPADSHLAATQHPAVRPTRSSVLFLHTISCL